MDSKRHHHSSSLSLELKINRAKNIDLKSSRELFVRCYLSAGNNQRVRLDSHEVSSKSNLVWNQTFSLDCLGTKNSMQFLKQDSIIFELRQRSTAPFLGRINGSKVLGRAEIPWKDCLESTNMKIEKWVVMNSKGNGRLHKDVKPPAVHVAVRIQELAEVTKRKKIEQSLRKWDECGCMDGGCNSCLDYEIFAIGSALELAL